MIRYRILALLLPMMVLAIPLQMNHQGMLRDAANQPLSGAHNLTFRLYDGPTLGDSLLWTETYAAVAVANGLYAVQLGESTPLTPLVLNAPQLWLGVTVDGDPEMTPRIRVVSTPYAICALKVDSVTVDNLKDLIQLWAITPDADGDGHNKFAFGGDDCDDLDPSAYAGAPEICDGKDNDCDHTIDEGVAGALFRDTDGDGYGDPTIAIFSCNPVNGYVANQNDCNDGNPGVNPNATEVCDNQDNDCDGQIDEGFATTWFRDQDGDAYGDPAISIISCSMPSGYVSNAGDCDDSNPSINPGTPDICGNFIDDNCDGLVDPSGSAGCTDYWQDFDHDGYGDTYLGCLCFNYGEYGAILSGDCDDSNINIHPNAVEICSDGIDNDCNGLTDGADPGCN